MPAIGYLGFSKSPFASWFYLLLFASPKCLSLDRVWLRQLTANRKTAAEQKNLVGTRRRIDKKEKTGAD